MQPNANGSSHGKLESTGVESQSAGHEDIN